MSRLMIKRILRNTANQVVLTSTGDGFYDLRASMDIDESLQEDFDDFLKEAEVVRHGELISLCWGPQRWVPEEDNVQHAIVEHVKEWDTCFNLVIERANGNISQSGYLADFPEFHAISVSLCLAA